MRFIMRHWRVSHARRFLYNNSQAAKVANLGLMTEYLSSEAVPHLLHKPIKLEKLDPNITLRLFPTTHAYLPRIQGITRYKHTMPLLTLVARSLVLHECSGLHVTGVETITGVSKEQRYNTITGNDKIVIHWQTCEDDRDREVDQTNSTSAKKHSFTQADLDEVGRKSDSSFNVTTHESINANTSPDQELLHYILSPDQKSSREFSGRPLTLLDELKKKLGSPRTLHGLFIFELNSDNTKILVHTIDNVEIFGRHEKQEAGASLAC
ncbi:Mco32p LALA0_S15e00364g [Lachancea lanzarotensis]|uniref:LALA0S15e00364g1_1 n=1 Tax=Lachancea lanzarotensis TaxID=1245769 RepID=A0A0C7N410_9SACH|nr:uncharacterized protein LALA0_S15e00364g [Lachancea lanzarotensis]CEP64919.1 LALA0S15e00364g1_1 [Lachancea lanzarotensis]